jgi:all-trans-retinol 13,14-reductase
MHYTGSFAPGEILDLYFRYLGLTDIVRTPYDPNCFDRLRYPAQKFEFELPVGYEQLRARLCENFPRDAKTIATYIDDVRKNFENSSFPIFTKAFQRMILKLLKHDHAWIYLNGLPMTAPQIVLAFTTLLNGVPPRDCLRNMQGLGSYYQSVHGIGSGGELGKGF